MRRSSSKLNTKMIVDAVIASLLVNQAPAIVGSFTGLNTPGLQPVIGGGTAYLVGSIMKKPNVSNIGLALALSGFVEDLVSPMLAGITGTTQPAIETAGGAAIDKSTMPALSDYAGRITRPRDYAWSYEV